MWSVYQFSFGAVFTHSIVWYYAEYTHRKGQVRFQTELISSEVKRGSTILFQHEYIVSIWVPESHAIRCMHDGVKAPIEDGNIHTHPYKTT